MRVRRPGPMDPRLVAIRSVNDGVASFAAGLGEVEGECEWWSFHCECGNALCAEWVDLPLGRYDELRLQPDGRVLAPGHPVVRARQARAIARRLSEEARALRAQAEQAVRRAMQHGDGGVG